MLLGPGERVCFAHSVLYIRIVVKCYIHTRTVHIVDILLYIKGDYMHLSVCCRLLKVYNIIYTYISYEYSVRVYGRK